MSDSESDSEDFGSMFTVDVSDMEKMGKKPNYLLDKKSDDSPCSVIEVASSPPPVPEKRSRVADPSANAEFSPIVILDDEIEEPARGVGGRRGKRRQAPSRKSNRRNRGAQPIESLPHNIPAPEFVRDTSNAINWSLDDTIRDVSIDLEEENCEISVKVCWKSKTVTPFTIRKYQKLSSIFEFYAKQEGISPNQLQLTLGDRILSPEDSPDSLSLTIAHILEGGILTSTVGSAAATSTTRVPSPVDLDSIRLKVRRKNSNQPVIISIKKTQKMLVFMTKYAEKCELPIGKLKFSFDGETINPSETPEDLDLEGDEMIELTIAE